MSLSTQTLSGSIRTVTYTPTAPPSAAQTNVAKSSHSGGLSTGASIGIAIALALFIIAIVLGIVYYYHSKRKDRAGEFGADGSQSLTGSGRTEDGGRPGLSRPMSQNSEFILKTDGRTVSGGFEVNTPARRQSNLNVVDPRLDPFNGLYGQGNKSRESVNTLNDGRDYSRKLNTNEPRRALRVLNPDED